MKIDESSIRSRVTELVLSRFGRIDEELIASGVLDSLGAIAFALSLEQEFRLDKNSFGLKDMLTIESIVQRVMVAAASKLPGSSPTQHSA